MNNVTSENSLPLSIASTPPDPIDLPFTDSTTINGELPGQTPKKRRNTLISKANTLGNATSSVVKSCFISDKTTPFFGSVICIIVACAASVKCLATSGWLVVKGIKDSHGVPTEYFYQLEGTGKVCVAIAASFIALVWLMSIIRIFRPRNKDGSHYPTILYLSMLPLAISAFGLLVTELVWFYNSKPIENLQQALIAQGNTTGAVFLSPGAINCVISASATALAIIFMIWDAFYKWPDMSTSEPRKRFCWSLSALNLLFLFSAGVYHWADGWLFTSSYIFTVNAASTVGLTDLYASSLGAQIAFYILSPLCLASVAVMSIALKDVMMEPVFKVYHERYLNRTDLVDHEARLAKISLGVATVVWIVYWFFGAWLFYLAEQGEWSYQNSLFFAYNALTTIGMSDMTPNNPITWEIFVFYVMFEMSVFAWLLSTIQEVVNTGMRNHNQRVAERDAKRTLQWETTHTSTFDGK